MDGSKSVERTQFRNSRSFLPALAMLLGLCALAQPDAHAQSAYQGVMEVPNCRAVSITGTAATAICRTNNGQERVSTLQNAAGCTAAGGMIAGVDGDLQCVAVGSVVQRPAQQGAPSQVEVAGCRAITVDANYQMRAICSDPYGQERVSSLPNANTCTGLITNVNGQLSCPRGYAAPAQAAPMTPGPSQVQVEGCHSVTVSANYEMRAICRDPYGQERVSSLAAANTCTSLITNVNGQLSCTRAGYAAPPQAAAPSQLQIANCRNVSVSAAGDVTALCMHPSGSEHMSTLQSANACTSVIVNVNGQLTCNRGSYQQYPPYQPYQPPR